MEFAHSKLFKKQFQKLPPGVRQAAETRIELFKREEFHPLLNNHKLKEEFEGYRSINVTGDYRIIFKKETEFLVRLEQIGTHPQLYGK